MFSMKNICGHIQVYDYLGKFLFSADNEGEAWKEIEENYEEYSA